MAEIVNLNQARKAKGRADDKAQATANDAAHGRTKAEKSATKVEKERRAALLDGAKREE